MSLETILQIAGFFATLVGAAWALVKWNMRMISKLLDERFDAQERLRREGQRNWEERYARLDTAVREREREHMELLAALPREYVRREDQIREMTTISAKLDAINAEQRRLADAIAAIRGS